MRKWLFVFAILLLPMPVHAAELPHVSMELAPGLRGELSFDIDPAPGDWKQSENAPAEQQLFSSENGYHLRLAPIENHGPRRLTMELTREKDERFTVRSYSARLAIPAGKIAGVWHSQIPMRGSLFLAAPLIEFAFNAAANQGTPFALCADKSGNTIAAIGWVDQELLTKCTGALINRSAELRIDLSKQADPDTPLPRKKLADALFAVAGKRPWFGCVQDYCRAVDAARELKPSPAAPAACEPAFSTWCAFGDDINEQRVWENAKKAKEIGLGTIVLEAGWDTPTGGSWSDPNGPYGDYLPIAKKFPDLAGLIDRIHKELQLKVELRISPFWVGKASTAEDRYSVAKLFTDKGEDYNLCPRHELTKAHLVGVVTKLMEDYKLDGLCLDYMDSLPTKCVSHHIHGFDSSGEAFAACARAMHDAIAEKNPDALIEYRPAHANPSSKTTSNLWQCARGPLAPETCRLLGISLRALAEGVTLRSAPAYWKFTSSEADAAKSCAGMVMSGAPSVSMDLARLPESQRDVLKAWIEFYRRNSQELLAGEFSLFGKSLASPEMKIEGKSTAFVYLGSGTTEEIRLDGPDIRSVVLLNCTDSDQLTVNLLGLPVGEVTVTSMDPALRKVSADSLRSTTHLTLDTKVPVGGMLVVTCSGD